MSGASLGERLKIRVNPDYDLAADPAENEFQYVNPVALNNDLVTLANEIATLADSKVTALKTIQRLKLDRSKAERKLAALELKLLRDEPLTPSEAKSNKTIAAAVARRALEQGKDTELAELTKQVHAIEDQIDKANAVIETADVYLGAATQIAENIKTHLSWVKDEKRRAYA